MATWSVYVQLLRDFTTDACTIFLSHMPAEIGKFSRMSYCEGPTSHVHAFAN